MKAIDTDAMDLTDAEKALVTLLHRAESEGVWLMDGAGAETIIERPVGGACRLAVSMLVAHLRVQGVDEDAVADHIVKATGNEEWGGVIDNCFGALDLMESGVLDRIQKRA